MPPLEDHRTVGSIQGIQYTFNYKHSMENTLCTYLDGSGLYRIHVGVSYSNHVLQQHLKACVILKDCFCFLSQCLGIATNSCDARDITYGWCDNVSGLKWPGGGGG